MSVKPARGPHRSPKALQRGAARLAAVQALYQIELTGTPFDRVLGEFAVHRLGAPGAPPPLDGPGGDDEAVGEADRELFATIVRGASTERTALDEIIGPALAPGWLLERMDRVLRAILRAGAYELKARPETPARVVITEYVDLANAFYEGREPGFVNGVLDKLARVLRPQEIGRAGPAAAAPEAKA